MTTLKKLSVLAAAVALLALFGLATGCERVDKPELKGEGKLALSVQAGVLSPEYHQPVEYWKQHHMDLINKGDYTIEECTLCHNVHTSCNNCHDYVGVNRVESFE